MTEPDGRRNRDPSGHTRAPAGNQLNHWIMLDGPPTPAWMDGAAMVVIIEPSRSIASAARITHRRSSATGTARRRRVVRC
ncbi:hypothetical protein [Streptosporangium roseum]|uniref:hypothetical protein n=1 Tax=Streptosporangium roseum TaxID=2001 RepID=UPI003324ECBC